MSGSHNKYNLTEVEVVRKILKKDGVTRLVTAVGAMFRIRRTKMLLTFHSFMKEGEGEYVRVVQMLFRTAAMPGCASGEEQGRYLLKNQHLIPSEYERKCLIFQDWSHPENPESFAYLFKDGDLPWDVEWFFFNQSDDYWSKNDLVVRFTETRSAA